MLGFNDNELNITELEAPEIEMPDLPTDDKEPFQQKKFILHDDQAKIIDDALSLARKNPLSDNDINDNSNGNAIAFICEEWLARNDKS